MSLARISTRQGGGIERLGQRHRHRQRIAQVVIGQRVGCHHGQRVGLLPGGAACAPHPDRIVPVRLLTLQHFFQHMFLEQVQLRLMPEEAGFVNGEVLYQFCQLRLAFVADQQAVVGVEGIDAALLEPPHAGDPAGSACGVHRSACRTPDTPAPATAAVPLPSIQEPVPLRMCSCFLSFSASRFHWPFSWPSSGPNSTRGSSARLRLRRLAFRAPALLQQAGRSQ